jgi:hypothetical protein
MWFGIITLATALTISVSAAYYSILGLTAIFAAAFWPIVILGSSLEVGKVVATLWLHKYWDRAELQYKIYLSAAVAILMLLTSMGVFGFLSKSHTDQSLVSGDVIAKISIYDEKIKQARDNITVSRAALTQMDAAVDQTMSRSTSEQGADKATALRRSQTTERNRLLREIENEQKKIQALNDQRAPIAAEVRKVEAEVGPVKYIAALIYGDNPETNVLEKAVRWVIILIVIVFDPLALTLLLAATKSLEWERGVNIMNMNRRKESQTDPDKQQLDEINQQLLDLQQEQLETEEFFDRAKKVARDIDNDTYESPKQNKVFANVEKFWNNTKNISKSDSEAEHAPLNTPVQTTIKSVNDNSELKSETHNIDHSDDEEIDLHSDEDSPEKIAERAWKDENPGQTLKRQRQLYTSEQIDTLPWNELEFRLKLALNAFGGFGNEFPNTANKGDTFIRTDSIPSQLYKYNGTSWINIEKDHTDTYAYDEAYIDYLIEKLASGEYDAELLTDAERDSIEQRLNAN